MALAGAALLVAIWTGLIPYDTSPNDSHAYWAVDPNDLYARAGLGQRDAYLYSPAFAQAIAPLRALPFDAFRLVWAATSLAILADIGALPLLFFPPVIEDLVRGNIHILLAAAVVVGLRWPAAWAFPILTKATPGIGLLWFVARGEWRSAGIAVAATAGVIGLSMLLGGVQPWLDWIRVLEAGTEARQLPTSAFAPPLTLRLLVAALVIGFGARANLAWMLPIGVLIALPVIWPSSWALLVASVVLWRTAPVSAKDPVRS